MKRFTPTHQLVLGLALGVALGVLVPDHAVQLKPVRDLFLQLIRMVLAPLLFTTLVSGVAGAGGKLVGRLGWKAIVWFELATTVALLVGLVAGNVLEPGAGVKLAAAPIPEGAHIKTFAEFVLSAFPTSIVDAMARNDVLQVVVFSVLFGLAVGAAGDKARPIAQLADAGAEAMFKLVGFVMRFAPFGVGAAIAVTLGANGVQVLIPLLKTVFTLYAALAVFFVLLFTTLRITTGVHLPTFLRAVREPALIAFTTATSDAAMPRAMQVLEQLGIPRQVVGFVIPTGYAFNLDGSTLYLSLATLFVSQAAGHPLSVGEQITMMLVLMLSSKGVAGVPRASLVVLGGTLTAFHLPLEGVTLLLGVDALMDMGRTCVNVVGNCVATVVVAAWEKAIPPDAPIWGPEATTRGPHKHR